MPARGERSGPSATARLLITGLGTGYLPVAPGTWASAAACAVFLAVAFATGGKQLCVTGTMAAVAVAATIGCVVLGRSAEAAFGKKDPGQCTLDEWAGQAVALCMMPLSGGWESWLLAAGLGFVAFRLFDILKPPPVYQTQKLPAGWGIVADDLAAGACANLAAQLILRVWLALA